MKLLIAGSRSMADEWLVFTVIDKYVKEKHANEIVEIISGGALGVDRLAEKWAASRNHFITVYKADWKKYGKSAGVIRNQLMVDACDDALIIWDGESKGTAHTIRMLEKAGKHCHLCQQMKTVDEEMIIGKLD